MRRKKPIKILQVIARLNIGGPAKHVVTLNANLNKEIFLPLLVCGNVGPDEGDMSYLAKEKGIKPFIIPALGREISILDDIKSFIELSKIIKQFRPDIIHTHTAKAGTLGRSAGIIFNQLKSRNSRIRLVHTFHGHIFHSYFNKIKTSAFIKTERYLAGKTDKIIVTSPLQKEDICQKYKITDDDRAQMIPLGFDLSIFTRPSENSKSFRNRYLPRENDNLFLVGVVGRLTDVKNHRMFLEAVKLLKDLKETINFRSIIIGEGELKDELIKYSRDLAIQDLVTFLDWQKDMPSVYNALDIFVLTSLNEGIPYTLIEAMAAGKPVVATGVGGVPDLLGDIKSKTDEGFTIARNGILTPSGNSEILARALLFLFRHKDASKKMVDDAKEFVLDYYSVARMIKDHESLYNEMIYG
ncbi:glycosyltransferase [Thermodesulfobacteriota bacterium]